MSVLYIIDINLVVSLCTDYTPGGELVYWKWSHSGGEIGNLLGTWRGKVERHVGAPSNCLHSTKGIYAQKHLYHTRWNGCTSENIAVWMSDLWGWAGYRMGPGTQGEMGVHQKTSQFGWVTCGAELGTGWDLEHKVKWVHIRKHHSLDEWLVGLSWVQDETWNTRWNGCTSENIAVWMSDLCGWAGYRMGPGTQGEMGAHQKTSQSGWVTCGAELGTGWDLEHKVKWVHIRKHCSLDEWLVWLSWVQDGTWNTRWNGCTSENIAVWMSDLCGSAGYRMGPGTQGEMGAHQKTLQFGWVTCGAELGTGWDLEHKVKWVHIRKHRSLDEWLVWLSWVQDGTWNTRWNGCTSENIAVWRSDLCGSAGYRMGPGTQGEMDAHQKTSQSGWVTCEGKFATNRV